MNRKLTPLFFPFLAIAIFAACESETGPTPEDRGLGRTNGCIDTDCASSGGASSGDAKDAGTDAK